MTAKHPDEMRGEDNIEAPSNVIANWLEDEQPRTRMARYGAAQMPTAELLALCLSSGLPGENAVCCPSAFYNNLAVCRHCCLRPSSNLCRCAVWVRPRPLV